MSLAATKAVWEKSRARGTARLVLLALADFADDAGRCWPSKRRVADRALCPERTVRRSIAALLKAGELVKMDKSYRGVRVYQIAACASSEAETPDEASPPPVKASPPISPTPVKASPLISPTPVKASPLP